MIIFGYFYGCNAIKETELRSIIIRYDSIRYLLALAVKHDMHI